MELFLAIRREVQQTQFRLKVMQSIFQNTKISSRQVADEIGISNGSVYYVLNALIEKGFFSSAILRKALARSKMYFR